MKKQILLFTAYIFLFQISSFAQNVNIPDTNFKQGLIAAGVDVDDDGEIQVEEALDVSTISLSYAAISDMTGLEAFTNLESLFMRENEFTSLDISQNTKLKRINIEDNNLSNVDFSNNPLLEWINIWNCNFSEIDLTQNVNLENLGAANNNFTTLDISANKKLTSIYCHGNNLEFLNIKNGILAFENYYGEVNIDFRFNPNLAEICTDTDQIQTIIDLANSFEMYPDVNSDCNPLNNDDILNILVIGTNSSIDGGEAFSPDQIAEELQSILSADASITVDVNVVAEDIHMSKTVTLGLGGGGDEYNWTHHSHSLAQYYYWPEGLEARMDNLSGNGDVDWDYVVIGADPGIISTTPGYYSLGVNKVAAKVAEGDAQPLLLMMWPRNESSGASTEHFEEFTYRTADGAKVQLPTIPSGLAWLALPEDKKDLASIHPTPNGAYLTAASIYSHIYNQSASTSEYIYDDELADIALYTVIDEKDQVHYSGIRTFISPFSSCNISDDVLNYNHTGSSSENGIKAGLTWVFDQAPESLQNGGTSPINFNYGRANTNFEPNKRYKIDPALFDFSFGFPMQDHGNHGDVSMLYGLDRRQSGTINDTDLGVAQYMVDQSELPYARAIPIRTLFAQMKEASPSISAYRDSWHMHRDLDKAVGAFMFTSLTGNCAMGEEPSDQTSDQWRTWMAHKIGYETAWNLMYLEGAAPNCNSLVDLDEDGFNSYVDCDDNDVNINPGQTEEPYNGIDDDCNAETLDNDLDQDGFLNDVDCDDNDPNINTDQTEEPYNGIDDDCNAETPDDDLDQDGFFNDVDCDDNNSNINPDAEEIPNNGIDEDCDGMDLVSSTHELANVTINIYPNPVVDIINIDISGDLKYTAKLYDLKGKLIISTTNQTRIAIQQIPQGTYLLEIKSLVSGKQVVERIVKGY
ncbi:MAG: hypothetical protein ACJA1A_001893 [Saprospiraceae bacterium]|jgi:hypothetical protein